MVDQCSTCFFFRLAPASAGMDVSRGHCHLNAPMKTGPTGADYPWVPVAADEWCGEGATSGGASFALAINSLAGPVGPPGPAGTTGATGAAGANAPQWTVTAGAPSGGSDGDFWLNTAATTAAGNTSTLSKKIAGVWTQVGQWTSA